jgi:hypothetical protein
MAADPHLFIWIVYALWVALVVYPTVVAIGVKREWKSTSARALACYSRSSPR